MDQDIEVCLIKYLQEKYNGKIVFSRENITEIQLDKFKVIVDRIGDFGIIIKLFFDTRKDEQSGSVISASIWGFTTNTTIQKLKHLIDKEIVFFNGLLDSRRELCR